MSFEGDDNANYYTGSGVDETIRTYGGNDKVLVHAWSNSTADGGLGYDEFKIFSPNDSSLPGFTVTDSQVVNFEKIDGATYQENSLYFSHTSNVEIDGGFRNDFITVKSYSTVNADKGNDIINVYGTQTNVFAGSGDDLIWSFSTLGQNYYEGGYGNDRYVIRATDSVVERAGEGTDTVVANFDYTLGDNIENLELSGSVSGLVGEGNELDNLMTVTGTGAQTLRGFGGNDTMKGNASGAGVSDHLYGGDGDDTLYGYAGDDFLYGEAGNDHVEGGAGNDTVDGDYGDDWLVGGAGNDSIVGGQGDDVMVCGDGDDTVNGGDGRDMASYADAGAGVAVDLTIWGSQDTGGGGVDTLYFVEDLTGSDFDDILTGDGDGNALAGGKGNDTLYGGADDDRLSGGAGHNYLFGGEGNDVLESDWGGDLLDGGTGKDTGRAGANAGPVGVDLALGTVKHFIAETTDMLVSIENFIGSEWSDILKGSAGANTLSGAGGDDQLYGRGGADRLDGGDGFDMLFGGAGKDVLTGGAGSDTFAFVSSRDFAGTTRAAVDRITDFTSGEDHIDLTKIDADTGVAGNQAFSFIGNTSFTGHAGELRYETASGNTFVSGDINGDGAADFMLRLDGLHTLDAGDFIL